MDVFISTRKIRASDFAYAHDAMVVVQHGADDEANGTNLAAAYAAAKLLKPGGSALASDNRAAVVIPPGTYTLSEELELDEQFVDLIGMVPATIHHRQDDDIDSYIDATGGAYYRPPATVVQYNQTATSSGVIKQSVNDVKLSDFAITNPAITGNSTGGALLIDTSDNTASTYRNMYFYTMRPGGGNSWRCCVFAAQHLNGYWENCAGNASAFRVNTNYQMNAVMVRCSGGPFSFGGDAAGTASIDGKFYDCVCTGLYKDSDGTRHNGFAGFGGCDNTGMPIGATAEFHGIRTGDNSLALNHDFAGKIFDSIVGKNSCAGDWQAGASAQQKGPAVEAGPLVDQVRCGKF